MGLSVQAAICRQAAEPLKRQVEAQGFRFLPISSELRPATMSLPAARDLKVP